MTTTTPGVTLTWFAYYVLGMGLGLLLAPAWMCGLFGLPQPEPFWTGLTGLLIVALSTYYGTAGRAEDRVFASASVRGRQLFSAGMVVLVALGSAPLSALLIALVDVLGARWTAGALRRG